MKTYWEVWETSYDTFGESSPHVVARYTDVKVAERHAEILNTMWGSRARIEKVDDPEIEDITLAELEERFKWATKGRGKI